MIIARGLAIVAGLLILAAVAHATIYFTTGYGTPHAFLTITVAIGVGVASVVCGTASARALAIFLGFCIACGEGYNFLQSANRLIAASEAAQAPKREYAKMFAKVEADVRAAQAVVDASQTSQRLTDALHAKELADKAVTDKSAEKACLANCRQLLQTAADKAAGEVNAARAAIEADHQTALTNLAMAKGVLEGMKAPESPTPLADRLGVEPWKIDVLIAALGSIAINGLACGLMIFGAHGTRRQDPEPVEAKIIDITSAATSLPAVRPLNAKPVITLLRDCVPEAKGERASWADILTEYRRRRATRGDPEYSSDEFGRLLRVICEKAGIPTQIDGNHIYCVDRRLIAAPKRLGPMSRSAKT